MNTTTAAALRRYFSLSPRTRRYRDGEDLFGRMLEAIQIAATQSGYYTETTEKALRPAYGAVLAYEKHVNGYRIDGTVRASIQSLTPWQFAGFIDQMVAAGVTNTGEGERFFRGMAA